MIKKLIKKLALLSLFVLMIGCSSEPTLSSSQMEWKRDDSGGRGWSDEGKKVLILKSWNLNFKTLYLKEDAYKFRKIVKNPKTENYIVHWGWYCIFNNNSRPRC